ncbi:hypothetical protein [Bosea lathyri]|uniref:Portal protein n=1 Tax=Bosea lathyri TaxID=1036778 RepID=A0A1H6BW17_9HYPH|nr:hypothetical protein [Bosea lathyri]SEG64889.1 hypothetical protein SAMN04488115_108135 [Bosea lathyri]
MALSNIIGDEIDEAEAVPVAESTPDAEQAENEKAQVLKIQGAVKADKKFHEKAFEQMRSDMFAARKGYDPKTYPGATSYVAPITRSLIKSKTDSLYAKNPKATAKRKETLDFVVWDETPQSLQMAFQTVQMAQQMMAAAPQQVDLVTGEAVPDVPQIPPEMMQAFQTAQEVIADYQQGTARRKDINKLGKTLEILYSQALTEQKPVDFKTGMKSLVRRALTNGVGYVELDFQRQYGPRPGMTERLADARTRLDHLRVLQERAAEGEIENDDAEMYELETSIAALEKEPEVILREGLIVDFPPSTRVIPHSLCKSLVGFIGARRITIEYLFTCTEIQELFGVDIKGGYKAYSLNGKSDQDTASANMVADEDGANEYGPRTGEVKDKEDGLVCVWKHFDKPSGLVYYVADGHNKWLRPPAPPNVFVEDFWPVYAITFNDVEDENYLWPPSDVQLIKDQQHGINSSRQGQKEHRKAARPRWIGAKGFVGEEAVKTIASAEPFTVSLIDKEPQAKINDMLEVIKVPGVDPNLYDTSPYVTDMQMSVGMQEAQFGGVAKATATESAIAANSTASTSNSNVDDLDAFLTVLARASGQILLREMSEEQVKRIAGVGAFWPHQQLADVADEIYLEVQAGSTGKPNQAIEIDNFNKVAPIILQIPGLNKHAFLKEALRRLDDRMDLTEMFDDQAPSIIAQNAMASAAPPPAAPGEPGAAPEAQGGQGADNAPKPPDGDPGGSDAAFGSNQV